MDKLRVRFKVSHPVVSVQVRCLSPVLGAFRYDQWITLREFSEQVGSFFKCARSLDVEVVSASYFVCHALHEDSLLGEDPRGLMIWIGLLHEQILKVPFRITAKNSSLFAVTFLQRNTSVDIEIIGIASFGWINKKRFLRGLARTRRQHQNEVVTGQAKPPLSESGPPSPETLFHRCGCITPSVANAGQSGEAWCS